MRDVQDAQGRWASGLSTPGQEKTQTRRETEPLVMSDYLFTWSCRIAAYGALAWLLALSCDWKLLVVIVEKCPGNPYWYLAGFVVTFVVGRLVTSSTITWLRDHIGIPIRALEERHAAVGLRRVPPGLTGFVEQVFFFVAVIAAPVTAVPAMIGWMTLKMLTNWNRPTPTERESERRESKRDRLERERRERLERETLAFSALVGSLLSLGFALLGGLLFSLGLPRG